MLILNRLSGFGVGSSGPQGLTSISLATSAISTNTLPSGILAGDLIVTIYLASNSQNNPVSPPADFLPSGFTKIDTTTFNRVADSGETVTYTAWRLTAAYKLASGSESGTNIGVWSGQDSRIAVFRGDTAIANAAMTKMTARTSENNPSSLTIASSNGISPVLVLGFYTGIGSGFSGVNPRTMTPEKDGEIGGVNDYIWIAYKMYNLGIAPSNVDIDMDDEGLFNVLFGCYFSLSSE